MSPFVIGMAVFFLAAAACGALFYAITPRSRVVDERFADLAVKVRGSQGAREGSRPAGKATLCCGCFSGGLPSAFHRRIWILPPARNFSKLWPRQDI